MKLTVQDIFDLNKGLNEIGEMNNIPIKLAFRIQLIVKKVRDEHAIANDLRTKLIKKYRDDSITERVEIEKDHLETFNKEHDELMEQEVEIKHLKKIDISELESIETIKPNLLLNLNKVLTDGGEK